MSAVQLKYNWLEQNLRFVAGVADAGPRVKARGERYASASCHLAMALHNVLDDPLSPPGLVTEELDSPFKQLETLMDGIGNEPLDEARVALVALVRQVPMLCDVRAFAAPAGMHDLPEILATAYYGRTGRVNFSTNYRRAINRLHWLLLMIKDEDILLPGEGLDVRAVQARLVERICSTTQDLEVPLRLQPRTSVTGRDIFPTPAAIIAAIGTSHKPLVEGVSDLREEAVSPRARAFIQFVKEIDARFIDETMMHQLDTGEASTQARYLAHMRAMLQDAAPRLAAGVMPCDRTPIVSPWYASIVLAVRNYAITLAYVLGAPKAGDASAIPWTLFSLSALADTGVVYELASKLEPDQIPIELRPFDSLFAARSKSMYVCSRKQGGPWWVLLRATLSGLTVADADELAAQMLKATRSENAVLAGEMRMVMRNSVMLCALMHTQTGMRVLGYRARPPDPKREDKIADFPLAALVKRVKDPICGQTPIDMMMTTYSGTSDLAALASDDLAFNEGATRRHEYAWIQELALRSVQVDLPEYQPPSPTPAVVTATVDNFCGALQVIGMDYLEGCSQDTTTDRPEDAVPEEYALNKAEMLKTLCRASTADASLHCSRWLTIAFYFAVELEKYYQTGLGERPLLRSPCRKGLDCDRLKDEAWLRSHFCYMTEQALHSSRSGGMWAAGKHLVLVAWVATEAQDIHGDPYDDSAWNPDRDGVMMFARAITPHTVRGTGVDAADAQLLSADWRREVEARGWDSVKECAHAFEHALHHRNAKEVQRHELRRVGQLERYKEQFPDKSRDVPLPLVSAARMPVILAHSVDRTRAAASRSVRYRAAPRPAAPRTLRRASRRISPRIYPRSSP